MLAQGPTCALARVSYMTSTRPNAQVNHYPNGPILHRDMAPFYSAIDSLRNMKPKLKCCHLTCHYKSLSRDPSLAYKVNIT